MSTTIQDAFDALRNIGTVEQMQSLAAAGFAPPSRPRLNMHIHLPPNFSAFGSVAEAVDLAARQGVGVLCASNYYDYEVFRPFADEARRRGIFPLFGTEIVARIENLAAAGVKINDPGNPGKMYVCGKGITRLEPLSDQARELLCKIRDNDSARMVRMTELLAEIFRRHGVDTGLTGEAVRQRIVRRYHCPPETVYLQERHLCQAFQEVLFEKFEKVPLNQRTKKLGEILGSDYTGRPDDAVAVQGEIRTHLMKAGRAAFVAETFCNLEEAVRLILELGGVPCYPTLADGARPICPYEQPVDKLIENLRANGLHCAEFIPLRNSPAVLGEYVLAMRRAGIVISAGTEHNTLDMPAMVPACAKAKPLPREVEEIFWEGACVIAAHQFLVLHGRCGFVDEQGRINSDYDDDEERIQAFAGLGAAVIQKFFETFNSN